MAFDPDQFIAGSAAPVAEEPKKENKPVSGFDPDAFVASGESIVPATAPGESFAPSTERGVVETGMALAAPAITAYGMSGPAISPAAVYEKGVKPFTQAGAATIGRYIESPLKAGVDVSAMLLGSPVPPVGTLEMGKTLKNTYEAGKTVLNNINEAVSYLPKGIEVEASTFLNDLSPEDKSKLLKDINSKGLDRAIKDFKAPAYLDEYSRAALKATQEAFPSGLTKLGRAMAPVARTAARVAGPAGLAYDIYEAYPYYQQANVPQRLATGEVRQTMNQARMAPLNAPTPAPLTAQEAQNLYQSGDQRLINIYQNDAELKNLMRRRAAERVLPVAPR